MPPSKKSSPKKHADILHAERLFGDELSARHREILEAAALLFAKNGYAATSIRDIGEAVGLLGGSLYHYIKSKEALFLKIHDTALRSAGNRISHEIAKHDEPWARLEAACLTLLNIQLDPNSLTMPLMNDFRAVPSEIRTILILQRDEFEQIFIDLVADLPLDPKIDRKIYRLMLLTLLNNIVQWYRPGQLSHEQIAQQIALIFRHAEPTG